MSQRPDGMDLGDPFGVFKAARDSSLESWSKIWIDAVKTPEYAQGAGTVLDTYLTTMAPMQQMLQRP